MRGWNVPRGSGEEQIAACRVLELWYVCGHLQFSKGRVSLPSSEMELAEMKIATRRAGRAVDHLDRRS